MGRHAFLRCVSDAVVYGFDLTSICVLFAGIGTESHTFVLTSLANGDVTALLFRMPEGAPRVDALAFGVR